MHTMCVVFHDCAMQHDWPKLIKFTNFKVNKIEANPPNLIPAKIQVQVYGISLSLIFVPQ